MTTTDYVLGREPREHARLREQAAMWAPSTAAVLDRIRLPAAVSLGMTTEERGQEWLRAFERESATPTRTPLCGHCSSPPGRRSREVPPRHRDGRDLVGRDIVRVGRTPAGRRPLHAPELGEGASQRGGRRLPTLWLSSRWHKIVSDVHIGTYRRNMREHPQNVAFVIDGHDRNGRFVRSHGSYYRTWGR